MVGVSDLDQYGSWEDNPTYGPVWYPTVVTPDWAPYRDGYWTDVGAWGLTWVDAALWGYAPSHYGRWVHVHGRWGWCPGPRVRRPHWAPALVGWYGGASWGITANGGEPVYAWVPLGWGDAYTPWWRGCSQSCWNRYNKPFGVDPAARTNARPRYSYVDFPGAMTAVPGATLAGRKPVRSTRVPLPASQLSSAPLLATPPNVVSRAAGGQAFRPGERGTPTPASALYSHTRRATIALPVSAPTASPIAAPSPVIAPNEIARAAARLPPVSAPALSVPAPNRAGAARETRAPPTAMPMPMPMPVKAGSAPSTHVVAVPAVVPSGITLPALGVALPQTRAPTVAPPVHAAAGAAVPVLPAAGAPR
jgi:hypothetical protein